MMNSTTPQIEAILQELTDQCCKALENDASYDQQRIDDLLQSLSANGWERHTNEQPPLSTILEQRILSACKEPSIHRGAALSALVSGIQQRYDVVQPDAARSPQ